MKYTALAGLGLAAAAFALLAGCGGDSGSSAPPPPPPPGGGTPSAAEGGAGPAAAGAAAFDPAGATATVKVTCTLEGEAPKMRPIKFDADPKCGEQHAETIFEQSVIASDGKLANVVVYVSKGAEKWSYQGATEPVVLDQHGCMYEPHVFTVMTGQPITIKNTDPVMHNVHAVPKVNKEFNKSQLKGAKDLTASFDKEEMGIRIKCDVHGWMGSWASVFSHPFHGVTGEDGTVELKLPPGEYEIAVWHEYDKFAKPAAQKVTVGDGESKDVGFAFGAK